MANGVKSFAACEFAEAAASIDGAIQICLQNMEQQETAVGR